MSHLFQIVNISDFLAVLCNSSTEMLPCCRYIPDVSRAIYEVLERMATDRVGDQKHERTEKGKKKRLRGEDEQSQNVDPRQQYYEYEDADILHKVLMKEISQATLREKLSEHVEKVKIQAIGLVRKMEYHGFDMQLSIKWFRWTMKWCWNMLHKVG